MSTKFACALLVALLAVHTQSVSAHDRRDIAFPVINLLDPRGSIESFKNFTDSLSSALIQAAANAISTAENAKETVETVAASVVATVKADIESHLNATISKIQQDINNSPIGAALRTAACGGQGIAQAVTDAKATVEGAIRCVTDQIKAVVTPALDLIAQSQKGLTLGSETFNNLTSQCFPGGFSAVNILNIIPDLVCATGKFGDAINTIINIVKTINTDIQNLQTSVANTRNAIVRCPREQVADLVIRFGNIVTNFATCVSGTNA